MTMPVVKRQQKRKADEDDAEKQSVSEDDKTLTVEPHVIPNRGPYIYNQPKRFFNVTSNQQKKV